MSIGYIFLHRQLQDNKIWLSEKFTDGQAWIDILLLANHTSGTIKKRGIRIDLKRGELGWSEIELSKRWKWSRGKVRRFLFHLCSENMIKMVQQNNKVTTHITIINYNEYQSDRTTSSTTNGQQTDNKRYRNNNGKNGNNGKKFIKPSLEEVTAYCLERENGIDAQRFIDSNESKGWVVGKNQTPMKCWKSTIRTWEGNKKDNEPQPFYKEL